MPRNCLHPVLPTQPYKRRWMWMTATTHFKNYADCALGGASPRLLHGLQPRLPGTLKPLNALGPATSAFCSAQVLGNVQSVRTQGHDSHQATCCSGFCAHRASRVDENPRSEQDGLRNAAEHVRKRCKGGCCLCGAAASLSRPSRKEGVQIARSVSPALQRVWRQQPSGQQRQEAATGAAQRAGVADTGQC